MEDLQLTKELEETTAAINRDILRNPQKYKQAGKWLDQYYDKEFCQKKMQERSNNLLTDVFYTNTPKRGEYYCPVWHTSGSPAIKAYEILQAVVMVEFNHFTSMQDILERDPLFGISPGSLTHQMAVDIVATQYKGKSYSWLKDRLWLAHKEMLEIKKKCKFIGQEESVIVCLLTWLLANPDANRASLGITEFDKWEWYSLYESGVCSERADVIKLLHICKMLQDWQNLACEAWQNIKNIDSNIELQTEKDANAVFHGLKASLPAETKQEVEPDQSDKNKAYIKKGTSVWEFGFNGTTAKVEFKPNQELKGLVLIEYLLTNPNDEYTPLKLLQETEQRGKEETESEKIYTDKDIEEIKEAVGGLESRLELSSDKEEKERLEREIKEAKDELHKSMNYRGKSRKISDRYRLSVSRKINTVLNKIAPQSTQLYNHLSAFLNPGEICYYKPDKEIIWEIISENT